MEVLGAARLEDEIAHGFGLAAMIGGAVAGALIGAAVVAATAATGGLAAVIIAGSTAAGGLSMYQIVKGISTIFNLPEPSTGKLDRGSPDVFINNRPAMRAGEDVASSCSGLPINHTPWPFPTTIAEGSKTVLINNKPAARLTSKMGCGAHIKTGSPDVFIGGPTERTGFVWDLEEWVHTGLEVLGLAALVGGGIYAALAGVASLAAFAIITGGTMAGMEGLKQLGDRLGPGYGDLLQGVAGMALLAASPKIANMGKTSIDRNTISNLVSEGKISEARDVLAPIVDKGDVKGIVNRLDVGGVPKDKGAFWSGDKEGASAAAAADGKVIMEETKGGKVIDDWDYMAQKMPWEDGGKNVWGGVSENYAKGLEGEVTVYQTPDAAAKGGGYTFKTHEEPIMLENQKNGVVTDITYKIL